MKQLTRLLPILLAFAGLTAACSSSEYTRADFIEEITEGDDGFSEEVANCSADAIEEAGIEFDSLDVSADDIDPELEETVVGILFDCALADS